MIPNWTDYAMGEAVRHLIQDMGTLYVAMFVTTADPVDGLTNELTTGGWYSRKAITWSSAETAENVYSNSAQVTWSPTSGGVFRGLRVMDSSSGTGNSYFWQDLDQDYAFSSGDTIPIRIGNLQVGLANPS